MTERDVDQFSLRWDNFHSNMKTEFHALFESEDLVDVTLATDGHVTQAHKLILSACSPYFKDIFRVNPCKHPVVILKDVAYTVLMQLLQFIYKGEVNVNQQDLPAFLKTAELLQVKGLTGNDPKKKPVDAPSQSSKLINQKLNHKVSEIADHSLMKRARVDCPPPPVHVSSSSSPLQMVASNRSELHGMSMPVSDEAASREEYSDSEIIDLDDDDELSLEDGIDLKPTHEELVNALQGRMKTEIPEDAPAQLRPSCPSGSQAQSALALSRIKEMTSQDVEQGVKSNQMTACPLCEKTFSTSSNARIHYRDAHGCEREPFVCRFCGKETRNRSCLRMHIYRCHSERLANVNIGFSIPM